jgi:hypothetical protein
MYQRPEIKWRTDCGVTMGEIYSELGNLKAALAAQLAGVIIAWILGLTLSVCMPCFGMNSGQNRRMNEKVEVFLMKAEPVQHVCRIIPLIPSLIFTGSVSNLCFPLLCLSPLALSRHYCLYRLYILCIRLILLPTCPVSTNRRTSALICYSAILQFRCGACLRSRAMTTAAMI